MYVVFVSFFLYLQFHISNKSTACSTNTCLSGTIILLIYFVKKGHNSKTTAFRVMPFVLQLHLVMMSLCSKFDVDTFNTF